jgi:excisionase family DNA binding protein
VPVSWLREQLGAQDDDAAAQAPRSLAGLTVEEVASELGRSASTVRGWLIRGDLVGSKLCGREWRVKRSDLAAFIDRQSTTNGEPGPALGHSGRDRISGYRKILNPKEKRT